MIGDYICRFVTVKLQPSPVSTEHAYFGIIGRCDAAGFFSYKLARDDEKVISRIVNFFPKYGRANLLRAMEWAANDIEHAISETRKGHDIFANLIRPRENVIRYGAPIVVATDDPAAELEKQYEFFVAV
jgi:hypothetical protein